MEPISVKDWVIIIFTTGFTFLLFSYILVLTILHDKERKRWEAEREDLMSRVQAGTPDMYLRVRATRDQLAEGKAAAAHERQMEEKYGPKPEPETGDPL